MTPLAGGTIREGEAVLTPPGPLGVATSINFQPSGGGKAAESGQRLEIVLRGASEREAQEPFTDALPYAVRADDEPDDGRTP
jgi:hypothetical protein